MRWNGRVVENVGAVVTESTTLQFAIIGPT